MKLLVILFLLFNSIIFSQSQKIEGKVIDFYTSQPLVKANIYLQDNPSIGTTSDEDGEFILSGEDLSGNNLIISYIGYETKNIALTEENISLPFTVSLTPKIISSQSVLVEASIGKEGITPLAYNKIRKEEILENYTVQDIPEFLSTLPSTTFYSEGGSGIGYNYLSIRGFDQRRISVSINGIPQNDPEDHNVYWLDFPDLLANTEFIQVQRGSGSGVFGYPAIGGSINIITSSFSPIPSLSLSTQYGSYNTKKYSASFSSGLINNQYSVYAKLSQITSDGYRDLSWIKFNSYYLSAIRYDESFTTQLNFYGGPIEDGLAYTGLPKFAVKNKNLRKANYSDWGLTDGADSYSYVVPRRESELENFSQPHFELLNEINFSDNLTFNSALFLVLGKGFFDYDGSWAIPDFGYDDYFRLEEEGFPADADPTEALIRAQVENKQFGWIPRISIKHERGELIFGGELRFHNSNHWGRIQFANNLPQGYPMDHQYYFYNGKKNIINGFIHESYQLNDQINLLGEIQLAYNKYKLYNEKYVGTEFDIDYLFFNPRLGINYKISDYQNIFFSFARVSREPRLKEYYDAAESSGGTLPQFESITDNAGNVIGYDFNNPLLKPETMNDFELGSEITAENYNISLNIFYMLFNDEIVKDGQVDRFGQPTTGNVDRSTHVGVELTGRIILNNNIEFFANATYSKNKIEKGRFFIDAQNYIDLNGNRISGFPDFLANAGISYKNDGLFLQFSGKYVGDFYSDNYDKKLSHYLNIFPGFVSYNDNKNEAYFRADFSGSYEFSFFKSTVPAKIILQVNNVFDDLYSAYAIGKEFFPAAERNFLMGLQIGL